VNHYSPGSVIWGNNTPAKADAQGSLETKAELLGMRINLLETVYPRAAMYKPECCWPIRETRY